MFKIGTKRLCSRIEPVEAAFGGQPDDTVRILVNICDNIIAQCMRIVLVMAVVGDFLAFQLIPAQSAYRAQPYNPVSSVSYNIDLCSVYIVLFIQFAENSGIIPGVGCGDPGNLDAP